MSKNEQEIAESLRRWALLAVLEREGAAALGVDRERPAQAEGSLRAGGVDYVTHLLRVRLVHPKARVPERSHPTDAGLDLYAVEEKRIWPGDRALIPTGIEIALPSGHEGQVRPRSGLAVKHGITVLNSPGTIDQNYRGPVNVLLVNMGREPFLVEPGMRIAQLVVAPATPVSTMETDELDKTDRGAGGWGSSGV